MSLYERAPGVPPIRIGSYKKPRRSGQQPPLSTTQTSADPTTTDVTYQDFFFDENVHHSHPSAQVSG